MAPFVQHVRLSQPRFEERRERPAREIREVAAAPVLYHPAYLTGRVVRVVRNSYVVLAPPTGRQIVVRCACAQVRPMQYVALPATYNNGSYYAYGYPDGYSPQYYPQVAQWYSNYYGSPVQYQNGYYVPQYATTNPYYNGNPYYGNPYYGNQYYGNPYYGNPYYGSDPYYNANPYYNGYSYGGGLPYNGNGSSYWQYLPIAAALLGNVPYVGQILDTLSNNGGGYGNAPYYGNTPYYGNAPYYGSTPYYGGNSPYYGNSRYYNNSTPYYGNTPYDQCYNSASDNGVDGDGACVPMNGYNGVGYNGYGTYNAYGLPIGEQQVQGVVVGRTGSMLMVLGANGLNPILVNAAPALQSGYSMNGPIAVGQVVSAFGYYAGNTFVATALV